jgi:hypothetical protein
MDDAKHWTGRYLCLFIRNTQYYMIFCSGKVQIAEDVLQPPFYVKKSAPPTNRKRLPFERDFS